MFWGLANCPPETVERVLGNYNKIMEKNRLEEKKKKASQRKTNGNDKKKSSKIF